MKHKYHYNFFVLISLLVIALTILLHPSVSSLLLSAKRSIMLNDYMAKIIKTHSINGQDFWQFREFYYPGTITVNKNGLPPSDYPFYTKAGKPIRFTIFRSRLIESDEYLVNFKDLAYAFQNGKYKILDEKKSIAYAEDDKGVDLIFIKPVTEMVTANGFLDYKDKDKKLLEGKHWLVITRITK